MALSRSIFIVCSLLVCTVCSAANATANADATVTNSIKGYDYTSKQDAHWQPQASIQAVVFYSIFCPCSKDHIQQVAQLSRQYKGKVDFVGVHANANEPRDLADEYFTKAKLPFAVFRDQNNQLADAFGALKTPHVFLYKNGQQVFAGPVSDSKQFKQAERFYLKEYIEHIVEGKEVEPVQKRPLGCYIGRK